MGKIDAALARMAGHRAYLDTNVFIGSNDGGIQSSDALEVVVLKNLRE